MHVRLGGGCPCDAVRFKITEVFDAGYCHCNRCRISTRAPVFAFVHVPRAAFSLLNGRASRRTLGTSWPRHDLRLLSGCVYFDMGERDLLSIGIGRSDEPARVRPTFHQCVSQSRRGWKSTMTSHVSMKTLSHTPGSEFRRSSPALRAGNNSTRMLCEGVSGNGPLPHFLTLSIDGPEQSF
jgi:hypothetical protein